MRDLGTATLLQAQKDMGDVLAKIVIGGVTYGVDSTNRLLRVKHTEQPYSQTATVLIDNRDKNISALPTSLEGVQGVLSWGYHTSAGDEYSATAPLIVKAQELYSAEGTLDCLLNLYGIPDQMNEDEASAAYTQTSDDTNTVKALINAIAGATLACYSHCTAITVDWDTGWDDGIINSFQPKDYFRIYKGETRLAKIKELLGYTYDVMLVKADGHIHIFNPTISGTTYDYEYNDTILSTNHTFFAKVYRNRLVLPNKVVVASDPDNDTQYSSSWTSAASYVLLPKTHFVTKRLASSDQALAIAKAQIQRLELDHERGNGLVPMNVGQEVYDYVKITDSREGDNRVGNVGYLIRNYDPAKRLFNMQFGFGNILLGSLIGTGQGLATIEQPYATYAYVAEVYNGLVERINDTLTLIDDLTTIIEEMQDHVPKWHVTNQLIIPVE